MVIKHEILLDLHIKYIFYLHTYIIHVFINLCIILSILKLKIDSSQNAVRGPNAANKMRPRRSCCNIGYFYF